MNLKEWHGVESFSSILGTGYLGIPSPAVNPFGRVLLWLHYQLCAHWLLLMWLLISLIVISTLGNSKICGLLEPKCENGLVLHGNGDVV